MLTAADQGAATSAWPGFVASADEVGGRYSENCRVADVVDDPAISPALAHAPWTRACETTVAKE